MRRALPVCLLVAAACGGGGSSTCKAPFALETDSGACAGVSEGKLCDRRFCVPADATCGTTFYVEAGASGDGTEDRPFGTLAQATAAEAGDCIAIAAGSYQGAAIGPGVSLFGAGAAWVTLEGGKAAATLVVEGGAGARVRGVHVGGPAPGISAEGASGLVIEQVAVEAAAEVGIALFDSTAELRSVLVRGTTGEPGYGVYAQGGEITVRSSLSETNGGAGIVAIGGRLVARETVVRDNSGYGVAVQGTSETSTLEELLVIGNGRVGVFASGAPVRLDSCEVASTRVVDGGARLIEAQAGADVEIAGDSRLHDSEKIGVFVDASRLLMEGGECSSNEERGFWLQGIGLDQVIDGRSVMLDGVMVQDNGFVGVGGTEAAGLVIQAGVVGRTRLIPILDGASIVRAGDGLQALNGTDLLAQGVLLEGNERAAALFDASTGGATECIVDPRGGEKGLVIQAGVPADGFSGNTDSSGTPVTPEIPAKPLENAATLLTTGGLLESL